jgi:hypothetical protein
MFIKREKHPSPPFTRNYLTHKTLNKKVKGEGLKTLFYIYARQGKNPFFHFSDFPVFPKTLKKEYNIRFKIYPSPFTSSLFRCFASSLLLIQNTPQKNGRKNAALKTLT